MSITNYQLQHGQNILHFVDDVHYVLDHVFPPWHIFTINFALSMFRHISAHIFTLGRYGVLWIKTGPILIISWTNAILHSSHIVYYQPP